MFIEFLGLHDYYDLLRRGYVCPVFAIHFARLRRNLLKTSSTTVRGEATCSTRVVVALLVALTAGCSNQSRLTQTKDSPFSAASVTLAASQYEKRIQSCMKRSGFDYKVPSEVGRSIGPGLVESLTTLRVDGYGIRATVTNASVAPPGQFDEYLKVLGDPNSKDTCAYVTETERIDDNSKALKLKNLRRMEARDKTISRIDGSWANCMKQAGFEVKTPWDMASVLSQKGASFASPDGSGIQAFKNWELQTAATDATCRKPGFAERRKLQLEMIQAIEGNA
jgi:hypothetical protein